MKEELIKFETAKLAKEKGFDVPTLPYYRRNELVDPWKEVVVKSYHFLNANEDKQSIFCSAPTQALLQKWLRETKQINVYCIPQLNQIGWMVKVTTQSTHRDDNGIVGHFHYSQFSDTYEEALETGLFHVLHLL